jgi:hypothetical protein
MTLYSGAASGPVIIAAAPTSGVAQVETAQIVGTITQAGNATFTVTSAVVTGSPLAVSVAVALNDTATMVAVKAAVVMNANAAVSAAFVVTSNAADLIFTAKKSAANDATLNVAYIDGTCIGLTADATSNDTTAGVLGDFRGMDTGSYLIDSTNKKVYKNTGTPDVPTWTLQ